MKPEGRYEALRAEWERRRKAPDRGGGEWLVDKPELPLDAVPFLATLRRLGYQLQDQRFFDLHRELVMSDLIDPKTGKWSRFGTTLANPETQFMCEMIEQSIAAGSTEREAIAETVVELELDAASFDAAWKRIERLLHEWRKRVGQKPT